MDLYYVFKMLTNGLALIDDLADSGFPIPCGRNGRHGYPSGR
jgi:hypothetical protein